MPFKKYTQCYEFKRENLPSSLPYRKSDIPGDVLVFLTMALTLWGSATVIGLAAAPPFGALVGAIVGFPIAVTTSVAAALKHASSQWRFHRLICLSARPQCAVGTVSHGPKSSVFEEEYGDFDNDEYFDVRLMPHHDLDDYATVKTVAESTPPKWGTMAPPHDSNIKDNPANEIYEDGLQGERLLRPRPLLLPEPGYNTGQEPEELHTASRLHCEAEGDFWVRMNDLALLFGLLATALAALTAAGAAGGSWAGASMGCALGSWFFGPVGCLIGSILGGLLGALFGGAVAGAISKLIFDAILRSVFDAAPGEVEDANVGDRNPSPIVTGSRVAVLGEHVYDGFHSGWHEFHPLMAVLKVEPDGGAEPDAMLTWNPAFSPAAVPPYGLSIDDMKQGLRSTDFKSQAVKLRDQWCAELTRAFAEPTRKTQQKLEQRWTIHPLVDGCRPASGPDVG